MFRKIAIAAGAAAAIGVAAMPSAASAHWHHHHFWGGFYPGYDDGYGGDCYAIRKFVRTHFGLIKKRLVICN